MDKDNKCEQTEKDIRFVTNEVAELLISKNRAYGDSALTPTRIFSKADLLEQIKVRIDDKLSRLASTSADKADAFGEDVEKDLMGYLVLLRIARMRKERGNLLHNVPADITNAKPFVKPLTTA